MNASSIFAASLTVLAASVAAGEAQREQGKFASQSTKDASRVCEWAALDAVVEDGADGEQLALQIAATRGIEGPSLAVYRQRGRAFNSYTSQIVDAGKVHVLQKGANKGETVNPREKIGALTVAKRILATIKENEERAAQRVAEKPMRVAAMAAVASQRGEDVLDLMDVLTSGGDEATEAAKAVEAELQRQRDAVSIGPRIMDAVALLGSVDMATILKASPDFGDTLSLLFQSYREHVAGEEMDEIAEAA